MCRAASRTFPPDLASARRGRIWALRVLLRWGLTEPAVDDTLFLLGDLIGNAIAHTATPATLTLAVAEGSIEVAVADTAPLWMSGIPRQAAVVMVDAGAGQRVRDPMSLDFLDDDGGVALTGVDGQLVAQQPIATQVWFRRSVPVGWPSPMAVPVTTPGLSTSRSLLAIMQSQCLARGTETPPRPRPESTPRSRDRALGADARAATRRHRGRESARPRVPRRCDRTPVSRTLGAIPVSGT